MPAEQQQKHYDEFDTGPEWGTPEHIWEPLSTAIGGFELDPASGAEPEPIAHERYTIEENGLEREWYGDVWLNPPYGRSHNSEWGERVVDQAPNCTSITALVPASTATHWFHDSYLTVADAVTLVKGRLSFIGDGEHNATFGNVIVTVDNTGLSNDYYQELSQLGAVLRSEQ